MASSDVSAKRIVDVGSVGVGPARVRQLQVLTNNTGAGRLTMTDGDGGATLLDIDFKADDSHSINIPDYGVRFQEDVFITAFTNIDAITVFHS